MDKQPQKFTNAKLQDAGMERSVLAGIIEHGADLLLEIEDILEVNDFYKSIRQTVFKILKHMVHQKGVKTFDPPTIISCATELGFYNFSKPGKDLDYLNALFDEAPSEDNTKLIAIGIYNYSLARKAWKCLNQTRNTILNVTGEEDTSVIVSMIEDPIFEFTGQITGSHNQLLPIAFKFEEIMKARSETPQNVIGLPTGFPNWDYIIGGGFRRGSVNVVGARPKKGKSFFCLNVARNIAAKGIPVLYLDTEMLQKDQMDRLTSLLSGIDLGRIESGQFSTTEHENQAVWSCQKQIESLPFTHCSIAGQSVGTVLSIARRWLAKDVGFTEIGKTKPCLIIYDYFKLMNSNDLKGNLAEHQVLGFLISEFHNFAVKWELPILATVQLNRGGVKEEGAEVVSGSDRISWLCTSLTILKNKTTDELNQDPPQNGTKKLIVTDTRFGPGMDAEEYINIVDHLQYGQLKEGKPFSKTIDEDFLNQQILPSISKSQKQETETEQLIIENQVIADNSLQKICKECNKLLPLNQFYRNKGAKDGRLNICKACHKKKYKK